MFITLNKIIHNEINTISFHDKAKAFVCLYYLTMTPCPKNTVNYHITKRDFVINMYNYLVTCIYSPFYPFIINGFGNVVIK